MGERKSNKPYKLTEEENFASFSDWKNRLMYSLKRDDNFKQFLSETNPVTWEILTSQNPKRGFTGNTADDKVSHLNSMLGLIASYAPSFLATDIEKNCTSLEEVWQTIREYYRIGQSEAHFMKLLFITREENERPQRLYQRILAHLQDNLLQKNSKLKHNKKAVTQDEDMSPTVERLAVLRWMELIHPKIPVLVQRTFAYDLQRSTLKDLQPQIADALDGFLAEIREEECKVDRAQASPYIRKSISHFDEYDSEEEVEVARAYVPNRGRYRPGPRSYNRQQQFSHPKSKYANSRNYKQCMVCKMAGKSRFNHSLAECDQVSLAEKRQAIRSLRVMDDIDDLEQLNLEQHDE